MTVARQGPWKLIRVADDPLKAQRELLAPLMLMHLGDDPAETTNRISQDSEKAADLLRRMEAWEEELAQPRWYDGSDWRRWQEQQLLNHKMQQ